jgi:hypothetical protein
MAAPCIRDTRSGDVYKTLGQLILALVLASTPSDGASAKYLGSATPQAVGHHVRGPILHRLGIAFLCSALALNSACSTDGGLSRTARDGATSSGMPATSDAQLRRSHPGRSDPILPPGSRFSGVLGARSGSPTAAEPSSAAPRTFDRPLAPAWSPPRSSWSIGFDIPSRPQPRPPHDTLAAQPPTGGRAPATADPGRRARQPTKAVDETTRAQNGLPLMPRPGERLPVRRLEEAIVASLVEAGRLRQVPTVYDSRLEPRPHFAGYGPTGTVSLARPAPREIPAASPRARLLDPRTVTSAERPKSTGAATGSPPAQLASPGPVPESNAPAHVGPPTRQPPDASPRSSAPVTPEVVAATARLAQRWLRRSAATRASPPTDEGAQGQRGRRSAARYLEGITATRAARLQEGCTCFERGLRDAGTCGVDYARHIAGRPHARGYPPTLRHRPAAEREAYMAEMCAALRDIRATAAPE